MAQTLRQLGELLLGAVPTVILLALLSGLYTFLLHKPLMRVLAERRERTEGAIAKARADIAVVEARTGEYEQRFREARVKVFKNVEARLQQAMHMRNDVIGQARAKAQAQVKQARAGIEQDKVEALKQLQAEAGRLASEIVRVVLRPAAAPTQVGGR